MARILVVEDSPDVHRLLVETLQDAGHEVDSAHDGIQARAALHPDALARTGVDLVVLDLMLPHVDGSVLLSELRRSSDLPVLVLSAKDAVFTKVDLLRLGADDYVTKPFDLEELTARIEVLLRRSMASCGAQPLVHGDIALDPQTTLVTRGGHEVALTATEFKILELLMAQPARVVSRPSIYEAVWDEPFVADDAAVKTHLSNLRTKLRGVGPPDGEDPIETVWGLGYRMRAILTQS